MDNNLPANNETVVATNSELQNPKPKSTEVASKNEISNTKDEPSTKLQDPNDSDSCDDLDDLDDMLDEFDPVKSEPVVPSIPEARPENSLDEEFEKQLQAEMAELFGDKSNDISMKFENMLKELGETAAQGEESRDHPSSSMPKEKELKVESKSTTSGAEASFQNTIKKTMERMAASGDQATAAAAALENNGDILEEMMKAMQSLDLDEEGGGEGDFSKALLGMMEQLTNKEILYEPMKELDDKFPGWMEKHANEINEADLERYKKQQIYVSEIVRCFESEKYDDDSAADKEYIVERMQKMQAAGSPPSDLVGDMAAAQEALGAPEEGCPIQ